MVLESLTTPALAEKRPGELFFLGALFSSISILLAVWIFEEHAGLVMVFLTVIAALPLFWSTMRYEEKKDLEIGDERTLLREHGQAVKFFIFFFAGVTLSYAIWYVLLPADATSSIFRVQSQTIAALNQQVAESPAAAQGAAVAPAVLFSRIFLNNVKVMLFALLFSFIYGYGALFILTWNASVIATALGNFIRSRIATAGGGLHTYFAIGGIGVLRYALHGIPEITAYFIAALAGGIFSAALMRGDLGGPKARRIMLDCGDLLVIALAILLLAAAIEVYITPIFF
jgi:uncharacterized membrane protein SpoIIM required for sporulation